MQRIAVLMRTASARRQKLELLEAMHVAALKQNAQVLNVSVNKTRIISKLW